MRTAITWALSLVAIVSCLLAITLNPTPHSESYSGSIASLPPLQASAGEALASLPTLAEETTTRTPVLTPPIPAVLVPIDDQVTTIPQPQSNVDVLAAKIVELERQHTADQRELTLLRHKVEVCDPAHWIAAFERQCAAEHLTDEERGSVEVMLSIFPVVLQPGEARMLVEFNTKQQHDDYDADLIQALGGPKRILNDLSDAEINKLKTSRGPEFMQEYLGIPPPEALK